MGSASASPGKSEPTPAEAARLIRETVPLYRDVADARERDPQSKPELQALLGKARKVERNLAAAQMIYLSLPDDAPAAEAVERRMKRLEELRGAIKSCLRQIESRLSG